MSKNRKVIIESPNVGEMIYQLVAKPLYKGSKILVYDAIPAIVNQTKAKDILRAGVVVGKDYDKRVMLVDPTNEAEREYEIEYSLKGKAKPLEEGDFSTDEGLVLDMINELNADAQKELEAEHAEIQERMDKEQNVMDQIINLFKNKKSLKGYEPGKEFKVELEQINDGRILKTHMDLNNNDIPEVELKHEQE